MTSRILIEGDVQRVGFRQFVKGHSKRLNLLGWVQNLPNGSVEIVVTGSQENVRNLVDVCRRGPFLARVKNVDVKKLGSEQLFSSFDIISQ